MCTLYLIISTAHLQVNCLPVYTFRSFHFTFNSIILFLHIVLGQTQLPFTNKQRMFPPYNLRTENTWLCKLAINSHTTYRMLANTRALKGGYLHINNDMVPMGKFKYKHSQNNKSVCIPHTVVQSHPGFLSSREI